MRSNFHVLIAKAVLFLAVISVSTSTLAESPWDARQRAAQAKNPSGVTLTLRLANNQTQFHQGEIIPVELVFSLVPAERYTLNYPFPSVGRDFGQETFLADPPNGVADPLRGSREFGGGYSGPGPAITNTLKLDLNEWLRFDKPGKYRVYVTSNRVIERTPDKPSKVISFRPTTSNIVPLEILPRDLAWEAEQLRAAINILDSQHWGSPAIRPGARMLRFLGTREAAREMTLRLTDDNTYAQRDLDRGLLGFADRAWLISEMKRLLPTADHAVSQHFLRTLVDVEFVETHPQSHPAWMQARKKPTKKQNEQWQAEYKRQQATREALLQKYWQIAADALAHKTGPARIKTLGALLDTAWNNQELARFPAVATRLPQLVRQSMALFDELPQERQVHLLSYRWRQVREFVGTDALLPILQRVVASPMPAGLWSGSGPYWDRLRLVGLAMRGIYEFKPDEGRRLILQEIQNPRHRTTIEFLSILPDQSLPELDEVLAANIEDKSAGGDAQDTSWLLVERYATPAIVERVKALMGDRFAVWACVAHGAPFAYLLRADPDFGAQAVEKALSGPKHQTGCYRSLLGNLTRPHKTPQMGDLPSLHLNKADPPVMRRLTPELEKIATAHLNDADAEVARDAARALGRHGTATESPFG